MFPVVPGSGPTPNHVLLCGEAPGYNEHLVGRPFVGRSGEAQEQYLAPHHISSAMWYKTNVVKEEYFDGNPDPTPELTAAWTPVLYDELQLVQPRIIVAVGRHAANWFLGEDATLELCHGIPHEAGAFDLQRRDRGGPNNAVIVPIYHPAAGFRNNDLRPVISWDYKQVARYVNAAQRGLTIDVPHDEYAGRERYVDTTGDQMATLLHFDRPPEVAIDTEYDTNGLWSIQFCHEPGTAYTLRTAQPDYTTSIREIQLFLDTHNPTIVYHHALNDAGWCRRGGLETNRCPWWDTMYAAYLLRIEAQGLKHLAWRWCGMLMDEYMGVVGDTCKQAQVEYLQRTVETVENNLDVTKPVIEGIYKSTFRPPRYIETLQNDGSHKRTKPRPLPALVKALLRDVETDKRNKDGEPVNVAKRWSDFHAVLRAPVEAVIGQLPSPSLEHVPRDRAIYYASRDADATLRLKPRLTEQLSTL